MCESWTSQLLSPAFRLSRRAVAGAPGLYNGPLDPEDHRLFVLWRYLLASRESSLCECATEPARTTRDNPSVGHAASLPFIVCMNIFVELSPLAILAIEVLGSRDRAGKGQILSLCASFVSVSSSA